MEHKCFVAGPAYFIPDPEIEITDSLALLYDSLYNREYKKGGEISVRNYQPGGGVCADSIVCRSFFLRPYIIELRYSNGPMLFLFGEDWHLRFRINRDLSVTFILWDRVIYN